MPDVNFELHIVGGVPGSRYKIQVYMRADDVREDEEGNVVDPPAVAEGTFDAGGNARTTLRRGEQSYVVLAPDRRTGVVSEEAQHGLHRLILEPS